MGKGDDYKREEGLVKCGKVSLSVIWNLVSISFLIPLAIFAWWNPDMRADSDAHCWAVSNSEIPVAADATNAKGRAAVDVTAQFLLSFRLSFFAILAGVVAAAIQIWANFSKEGMTGKMFTIAFYSAGCLHVLQYFILFLSTFWRYDFGGEVCSGAYLTANSDSADITGPTYMVHSGKMLQCWILFQYAVLCLSCGIFCFMLCCTNCTKETCGRLFQ